MPGTLQDDQQSFAWTAGTDLKLLISWSMRFRPNFGRTLKCLEPRRFRARKPLDDELENDGPVADIKTEDAVVLVRRVGTTSGVRLVLAPPCPMISLNSSEAPIELVFRTVIEVMRAGDNKEELARQLVKLPLYMTCR